MAADENLVPTFVDAGHDGVRGLRFVFEGVVVQHQCIPPLTGKVSPSKSLGSAHLDRATAASLDVVPSLETLFLELLPGDG